jgi:uncharacterized membrane protein AbrB (regulator of aidB expression)
MEKKIGILFSVVGIVLGFLSSIFTQITKFPAFNLLIVVIVVFILRFSLERLLKIEKKPWNWWLSNGIYFLILFWFITWTIIYNI